MTQLPHTRPFNLEHAKAGAPICCANGVDVEILKWDRKHTLCIIGIDHQDASIRHWRADGSYMNLTTIPSLDLVMTPLCFIDDKPVFVGDKVMLLDGSIEEARPEHRNLSACRWPAPEKVYPKTQMTDHELFTLYNAKGDGKPLRRIANGAIRHAIEAGQVRIQEDVVNAVDSVMAIHQRSATEVQRLQFDLARESAALGKAERLLESVGFRLKDGEWIAPDKSHFCGSVNGFAVYGDKSSIDAVKEMAERSAARDIAIAEAVREECRTAAGIFAVTMAENIAKVDLAKVVDGVKS